MEPYKTTQEILKFYGLPYSKEVENYLEKHTRENLGLYLIFSAVKYNQFAFLYKSIYAQVTLMIPLETPKKLLLNG